MKIIFYTPRQSQSPPVKLCRSLYTELLSSNNYDLTYIYSSNPIHSLLKLFKASSYSGKIVLISCCLIPDVVSSFFANLYGLLPNHTLEHIVYLHCDPKRDLFNANSSIVASIKYIFWRCSLHLSDKIVCVSQTLANDVSRKYHKYTYPICNYIDKPLPLMKSPQSYPSTSLLMRWIDSQRNEKRFIFVTHCYLKSGKNLGAFMPFLSENCNFSWLIIGSGPDYNNLINQAKSLNISDRVYIHEYTKSPLSLVRKCTAYISLSLSEGFGLSNCEAYISGMPIIIPHTPVNKEIFSGFTGVSFINLNTLYQLSSITSTIAKPSEADLLSFSQKYSFSLFCEKWYVFLESLS